jgi:hypothetical protein
VLGQRRREQRVEESGTGEGRMAMRFSGGIFSPKLSI